jgi:hypothetical protein
MVAPAPARLDGWKAIAEYLGRDSRTLQRWRDERGLPIHRVPGVRGGTVFAYASELDAWLRDAPIAKVGQTTPATDPKPTAQSPTTEPTIVPFAIQPPVVETSLSRVSMRHVVAFAVVVVMIAVGTGRWANSSSPSTAAIERVEVKGHSLVALDANGQQVWTVSPPSLAGAAANVSLDDRVTEAFPVDLDADGLREVIAFARPLLRSGMELGDTYALSANGAMLWRFAPAFAFRFDQTLFEGPWRIRQWFVPSPGEPMWMAFIHQTWWPSFVVTLNRNGQPTLKFVNSGHIEALGRVKTGRGTVVLAGGTNNEYNAASLALLAEESGPSTSPHDNGLWQVCDTCPVEGPLSYFLFPRSELNVAAGTERNFVHSFTPYDDGSIDITVRERLTPILRAIYHFSPDLKPESVAMSDAYWDAHAEMSKSGAIKHSPEQCPLRRDGVTIRMWDAESGWRDVAVPYGLTTSQKHS